MLTRILILIIKVYQRTLSRFMGAVGGMGGMGGMGGAGGAGGTGGAGGVCRFEPSCSRYAVACLELHGVARGSLLSIVRVCKCHPFHPGGYDPPPPRAPTRADTRATQVG